VKVVLLGEIAHGDLVRARVELRDEAARSVRERQREPRADGAEERNGLRRGRRRTRDEHEYRKGGDDETPEAHRLCLRGRDRNGLV
jgi:hypothetical protein